MMEDSEIIKELMEISKRIDHFMGCINHKQSFHDNKAIQDWNNGNFGIKTLIQNIKTKNIEKNIIVLKYSEPNNCYTTLFSLKDILKDTNDKEFFIDLKKGLWSYRVWKDIKIGESRSKYGNFVADIGIIGVYNKLNLQHLENMKNDSKEHTTEDNYDD